MDKFSATFEKTSEKSLLQFWHGTCAFPVKVESRQECTELKMRHILYFAFTSMVLLGCVNNEKPSTTDLPLPVVQLRPSDAPGSEHLDAEVEVKDDETAVFFLRRSFVHNDSVPTRGKDVRLIIHDGVITLRGVVESEPEKVNIHKLARQHGGQLRIENRLEIASSMDRVDDDPAVGPWFFQ